jgi:long-chain acyl-CoA synthetase
MNGYYRHGAEPVDRTINGWHRTNDLGRREEDGSITFIGPKQRMLKSGVENIYPAEVEQVINSMPGVAHSAIIGIPDPKWIQTVLALVVTDGSAEVDEAAVISHCKAHMASYKKPSKVIFLDAIAKKADGSIDYDQLDETHGGGNYPGGDTRSR